MNFETSIAIRYLRSKRKEAFISFTTWISVVGIAIGVMALIVVIAVMTGFQDEIRDRILGINPHVLVSNAYGDIAQPEKLVEVIKRIDGVTSVSPYITFQGMAQSGKRISGVVVKGISPHDAKSLGSLIKEGKIDALNQRNNVLLGKELARELGVLKGEDFTLLVPFGGVSPMGAVPATERLRVGGIFQTGMYEIDNLLMVMSINDVQQILGMGVSGIEIKLKDVYRAKEVQSELNRKLGPGYSVRTWMEMNRNLFSALKLEKIAMFIILVLIIFVASFNIISSLVMTVMEKKKDIAILKAMGARNGSIIRIFMAQGLTIGVAGAIAGSFLGWVLCFIQQRWQLIKLPQDIYYISTMPMKIDLADILVIAAVTIALCFLSTIYPSYKATHIDPVETLRYE
jgi:lipoprotein-releasing system permease protein